MQPDHGFGIDGRGPRVNAPGLRCLKREDDDGPEAEAAIVNESMLTPTRLGLGPSQRPYDMLQVDPAQISLIAAGPCIPGENC